MQFLIVTFFAFTSNQVKNCYFGTYIWQRNQTYLIPIKNDFESEIQKIWRYFEKLRFFPNTWNFKVRSGDALCQLEWRIQISSFLRNCLQIWKYPFPSTDWIISRATSFVRKHYSRVLFCQKYKNKIQFYAFRFVISRNIWIWTLFTIKMFVS